MGDYCKRFQERLEQQGIEGLREDEQAQEHLADCAECFAVFEALDALDPLLSELPVHDASDDLVAKTLLEIQETGPLIVEQKRQIVNSDFFQRLFVLAKRLSETIRSLVTRVSQMRLRGVLATGLTLVVGLFIFRGYDSGSLRNKYDSFESISSEMQVAPSSDGMYFEGRGIRERVFSQQKLNKRPLSEPALEEESDKQFDSLNSPQKNSDRLYAGQNIGRQNSGGQNGGGQYAGSGGQFAAKRYPSNAPAAAPLESKDRYRKEQLKKASEKLKQEFGSGVGSDAYYFADLDEASESKSRTSSIVGGKESSDNRQDFEGAFNEVAPSDEVYNLDSKGARQYRDQTDMSVDDEVLKAATTVYQPVRRLGKDFSKSKDARDPYLDGEMRLKGTTVMAMGFLDKELGKGLEQLDPKRQAAMNVLLGHSMTYDRNRAGQPVAIDEAKRKADESSRIASKFLESRSLTENLKFQEAKGYWANTYVPGDPTVRRLHTSLLGNSLEPLERLMGKPLNLHRSAQQTSQPFDPPLNSALAVYLHSDQRGIQGKRRMLVQVGLQGSSRRSGSRPAMNVAVVLDLRGPVDSVTVSRMREFLFAMNKARDIGDNFSLVLAGKSGGLVITPEQFRHGHLLVALKNIVSDDDTGLELASAIETAVETLSSTDDPTAALGSSAVLLVTNQRIGHQLPRITTLAHNSAVAGIPLSAIAIGDGARRAELEKIALAGQGNRRILADNGNVHKLVQRELSAVSEIVARAVRLRIRLAPGTKLVKIFGSYSLDKANAQRVRQAEQSIDRRLSRNLGIESDRGEDEEGIQIVIPAFYADTSHVVLLDVVTDGPGPIADVTVRYKDLVQLKNGVARANLSIGRNEAPAGALERNVLKNLLAFNVSSALQQASLALIRSDFNAASQDIETQLQLLSSFKESIPGFERDPDLLTDLRMLSEFRTVLAAVNANPNHQYQQLANSMAFAAKMKVLPSAVDAGVE